MKKPKFKQIIRAINNYVVFFLLVAFIVSCCMILFVTVLADSMGLVFTKENIADAAKLTFGNVLLITFFSGTIDYIRRKRMVDRPVKQILAAADKIMQGDFSVRIAPVKEFAGETGFNEIIACLNKMTAELAGTETLRTDFIANVSHELKTPLAVMGNYATMLQRPGITEDEKNEYAKAISESARRLAALITNILKLNKAHPDRLIFGSETFPQDIAKNWAMVKQYPYLIGDFMWTAWDYLGEVGLGAWAYTKDGTGFNKPYPWLLADTGAFDIVGTPNGEMFLAQAAWGLLDKPVIGVQPVNHPGQNPAKMAWRGTNAMASWAWQGCDGNKAIVEVFTDAAVIELLINSKSLGKKKVKECKAKFKTKYQSGKIEAVAYDASGREVSRSNLVSAAGKTSICAAPEVETARSGDVVYVNVAIVGENGVVESNADRKLTVTVDGGELLAFGSANPRTEERFDEGTYTTYYGVALAAVRVNGNTTVIVSDGKETAKATITVAE